MTAPRDSLIRRSLRRFMFGSGPLKRRSDRIQMTGRFLVALSLLLAPPIAVAVANGTTTHLQHVADAEAAARSRTRAVLLEDAGPAVVDSAGYGNYSLPPVQVRAVWSVPGGGSRKGLVLVAPRTLAGTAVPVWVDRDGNLAPAPIDRAGITMSANVMAALPLIGVPMAAWALYALLCLGLDVRRERRWEQDWAAVEPDWHSRLL